MAGRFTCHLNGTPAELEADDRAFLLDVLRARGLTGAKPSCEMEICGACTVLVDGLPVSSCTTLAVEVQGRSVQTIEGLAVGGRLSAVQEAFIQCFAFQCGFCTPGMILTAEALLDQVAAPTREQVLHWMEGNICRCTGYEPIVEAVLKAAAKRRKP
jgi:aerobic-type carbon monoxide dehydrogenase small subunit (CoxS/CutS family)